MNNKTPTQPKIMLWWVAIISLIVSGLIFFLLKDTAEVDVTVRQQRMIFPLIGVLVAGVCLIVGTAARWFK